MNFALLLSIACVGSAIAADHTVLRTALLLHAPFDESLDALVAAGDPKLYTAESGDRATAGPGLPAGGLVLHAEDGRFGRSLQFTKKMKPTVFFRGEKNLGYNTTGWSGAVSFWMRLSPDQDLAPGYCDPIQFVAQGWDEGNMFVEFSKDHTPRHFRYAILPVKSSWNPTNRGWEAIPDAERPMVPVLKAPFSREKWTHVVFCFGGINSGKKDGFGRLFLDGAPAGEFKDWLLPFNWDVTKSALTLGLSYVGGLDDLAVFNRPLTEAEVKAVFALKEGIRELGAK